MFVSLVVADALHQIDKCELKNMKRPPASQHPLAANAEGDLPGSATNFTLILHLDLCFVGPADLPGLHFTEAAKLAALGMRPFSASSRKLHQLKHYIRLFVSLWSALFWESTLKQVPHYAWCEVTSVVHELLCSIYMMTFQNIQYSIWLQTLFIRLQLAQLTNNRPMPTYFFNKIISVPQ